MRWEAQQDPAHIRRPFSKPCPVVALTRALGIHPQMFARAAVLDRAALKRWPFISVAIFGSTVDYIHPPDAQHRPGLGG